ncbi:MAG: hypothetical protein V1870_04100 [Candidatus Aenigmatarchaeota archaeon]
MNYEIDPGFGEKIRAMTPDNRRENLSKATAHYFEDAIGYDDYMLCLKANLPHSLREDDSPQPDISEAGKKYLDNAVIAATITFFSGVVIGAICALTQDPSISTGQYMTNLANYVTIGGMCGFALGSGLYVAASGLAGSELKDFKKHTKI